MKKLINVSLLFFSISTTFCYAGDPGGPNIVWVNLDGHDTQPIDIVIKKIILAKNPMCWNASQSYIYMKTRPEGITDILVTQALIKRNSIATKKLNYLLKQYNDSTVNGFDGLIAYTPNPRPTMIGLTTGRKKPLIDFIEDPKNTNHVEASFCMVMPDIVTKP